MKTAGLFPSLLALVLLAECAEATLFISLEGDARAEYSDRDDFDGELNSIGGSIRKVLADSKGDRLILYMQAEAAENVSEGLLHQAYAEWKGPMGRWNLAFGRVPMPWGLLTDWSPDRMPFQSPYTATRTFSSDNGVLVRGSAGMVDYGLALTQGYGMGSIQEFPGPGNLTGRVGITPDLAGDINLGLSLSSGTVFASEDGHGMGPVVEEERTAFAVDCTWYHGRGVYRVEGGGRKTHERWNGTVFGFADYALLPKLNLQFAGQVYTHMDSHRFGQVYAGLSMPLGAFTLRTGYEYEYAHTEVHTVMVQLYRLFSFAK